ncbi:hypothetical protein F5883DRAFT_522634 [Diaporthe sp. PMI_573]|nr:hypothetical protein F5883DRAFT_522634 [Diaporthaceae sp. PMI_573]
MLFSLCPPALVAPPYTGPDSCFYYLYLQLLGLFLSALVSLLGLLLLALFHVYYCQIGHACQRVEMVGPEPRLTSLYYLYLQLLGLFLPALIALLGLLPPSFVVVYATKRGSYKSLVPSPVLIFSMTVW